MKKISAIALSSALILFQLIYTQSLQAQCWSAVGGGVDTNNYYAYRVMALTSYNGSLIAGGLFNAAGGVPASNIAAWNGTTWSALGAGVNSVNFGGFDQESINAMVVYNNELYVAGVFDSVAGMPNYGLAKWNGTSWSSVSNADTIQGKILSMAVYNGNLYVAGELNRIGGVTANGIAMFNGTSWSNVGGGVMFGVNPGYPSSLGVYNGKLYVGGLFTMAGSVPAINIASWNGSAWSAMGGGLATTCGCGGVINIAGYQGDIYAAVEGEDTITTYGTGSLAKWDGSSWSYILGEPGTLHYPGFISTLCTYDGRLVLGGILTGIGTDSFTLVAECDGSTVTSINGSDSASNINFYEQEVAAVDSAADGHLYAGGFFLYAGNTKAQNIAQYGCTNGIMEISKNHISIYPNPTNGIINISIENIKDASIVIYDLMGEKVSQSKLNTGQTQLDLSGHASGTYLYRMSEENGEAVSRGSFVIR